MLFAVIASVLLEYLTFTLPPVNATVDTLSLPTEPPLMYAKDNATFIATKKKNTMQL